MTTTSPDARLLADIRARLPHTENYVDRALLQRCLAALSRTAPAAAISPTNTTTAESVAHRISADPSILAAIHQATDGLGPYFRLVAASKSIDCPRCRSLPGWRCTGERLCDERTWAYAAQRRQEKHPAHTDANHDLREAIRLGVQSALDTAIRVGIIRLERTPDGTGVQWVDAV